MMKRTISFLSLLLILALSLTSCRVNWFTRQYDVPWWGVAIPAAVFSLVAIASATLYICRKTYVCPHCKEHFRPTKRQAMFSMHCGSDRHFRCPHCGKKSFCRVLKDKKY